jgi:hypothetical protein
MPDAIEGADTGSEGVDSGGEDAGRPDVGATTLEGAALGVTLFFFAAFLAGFLAAGAAVTLAFTFSGGFLPAGFAAFLAVFFTTLLALLTAFDFFFNTLAAAALRFAFATGRFFALLFFFAMINFLLAVLRLLAVRVALKKSAVICA